VHGTNSNFILMPDLAVKSLDSSTRALAGSQAAQQRVSSLSCARAPAENAIANATAAPAHTAPIFFRIWTSLPVTLRFSRSPPPGAAGGGPLPKIEFSLVEYNKLNSHASIRKKARFTRRHGGAKRETRLRLRLR